MKYRVNVTLESVTVDLETYEIEASSEEEARVNWTIGSLIESTRELRDIMDVRDVEVHKID